MFSADRGRLNYLIVAGNAPLYKFGIKSATGGLFVAKTLDYEASDRVGWALWLCGSFANACIMATPFHPILILMSV